MAGGPGSGPHEGAPHPHAGPGRGGADKPTEPLDPTPSLPVASGPITREQAEAFASKFAEAFPPGSKFEAFVTHYTADEIMGAKAIMLDNDGQTGLLVKDHGDGRIEGSALFNTSDVDGAGTTLLQRSIDEQGVNYVECYGPKLPQLYGELGFKVLDAFPFDVEQASPVWNYDKFNHPDYNLMAIPGSTADVQQAAMRYAVAMSTLPPTDDQTAWASLIAEMRSTAQAEMSPEEWAATGENLFIAGLVQAGVLSPNVELPGDVAQGADGPA